MEFLCCRSKLERSNAKKMSKILPIEIHNSSFKSVSTKSEEDSYYSATEKMYGSPKYLKIAPVPHIENNVEDGSKAFTSPVDPSDCVKS